MKIVKIIEIEAPSKAAWKVVGEEFGEIAQWTNSLSHSSIDGALAPGTTRTCITSKQVGPFKKNTIKERLLRYDAPGMTLDYEISSGLPKFISKAHNCWSVLSTGQNQCQVKMEVTFTFKGLFGILTPLLSRFMRPGLDTFADELRIKVRSEAEETKAHKI